MRIHISDLGGIRLVNPAEFRSLDVFFDVLPADRLSELIARIGSVEDEDHIRMAPAILRFLSPLAGDADWEKGFESMLAQAGKSGWIDENGQVRVHISRGDVSSEQSGDIPTKIDGSDVASERASGTWSGVPASDVKLFRKCLGQFATGVTVITAQVGDRKVGVTANSFASVSLEPALILWSINRASSNFGAMMAASHFAVNILGANQIELAQSFGRSKDDKFDGVAWFPGQNGAPLLEGSTACLECRQVATYEGGDHVIIVGKVERFSFSESELLVFAQGRFAVTDAHPALLAAAGDVVQSPRREAVASPLLAMLYRAYRYLGSELGAIREAAGLAVSESRLLFALHEFPQSTRSEVLSYIFVGPRELEDAVTGLKARGLLSEDAAQRLSLTSVGETTMSEFVQEIHRAEEAILSGHSTQVIENAKALIGDLSRKLCNPQQLRAD